MDVPLKRREVIKETEWLIKESFQITEEEAKKLLTEALASNVVRECIDEQIDYLLKKYKKGFENGCCSSAKGEGMVVIKKEDADKGKWKPNRTLKENVLDYINHLSKRGA